MPIKNCKTFRDKSLFALLIFSPSLLTQPDMCSRLMIQLPDQNASAAPPLTFSSACWSTLRWQSVRGCEQHNETFSLASPPPPPTPDFPAAFPGGLSRISDSPSSSVPLKLFHALHSRFALLARRRCQLRAVRRRQEQIGETSRDVPQSLVSYQAKTEDWILTGPS